MEQIQRYEPQPAVGLATSNRPFWNSEGDRSLEWSNSPELRDRILLAAGLWTMLGVVALAVLVSRYLLPILMVASVLLLATLRVMGIV